MNSELQIMNLGFAFLHNLQFRILFVGREGFEPSKAYANGVTVRPIWPLWNLPNQYQALYLELSFKMKIIICILFF